MAFMTDEGAPIDRLARAHVIKQRFAGSPLFREVTVSEGVATPAGDVVLTVSFDGKSPALEVVAWSTEQAYAVLHELALAMVEIAHSRGTAETVRCVH